MVIGSSEGQLVPFLVAVFATVQLGILSSGSVLVSHSVTRWLSQYTRVEEPDPTMYMRLFERFFDTLFARIGWVVADRPQSPVISQLSFQISIGIAVIFISVVTYVVTASVLTGAALATYHVLGVIVDPVPLFRMVVAFVVVVALSVMVHAGERASQLPTR